MSNVRPLVGGISYPRVYNSPITGMYPSSKPNLGYVAERKSRYRFAELHRSGAVKWGQKPAKSCVLRLPHPAGGCPSITLHTAHYITAHPHHSISSTSSSSLGQMLAICCDAPWSVTPLHSNKRAHAFPQDPYYYSLWTSSKNMIRNISNHQINSNSSLVWLGVRQFFRKLRISIGTLHMKLVIESDYYKLKCKIWIRNNGFRVVLNVRSFSSHFAFTIHAIKTRERFDKTKRNTLGTIWSTFMFLQTWRNSEDALQ